MAIALDQNLGVTKGQGGSTSWAHTTTGTSAAAGTRIIVAVSWFGTAVTVSSCSGGGLTWVVDQQSASDNNEKLAFISADAPAGLASGTTITVTGSATAGTTVHVAAASFTGLATGASGYTTGTPGASDTTFAGTAWQTPNVTTGVADALLFAISCNDGVTPDSSTTTPPATQLHNDHDSVSTQSLATAYRVVASTGTYSIAGTWTGISENRRGIIAYAAGGSPTPTPVIFRALPSMLPGRPGVSPSRTPAYVQAAFPSTPILDDFNRAGLSVGTNWTTPWLTAGGTIQIVSNQIQSSGAASDGAWNPNAFGPDCECYVTVAVLPAAGGQTRLLLRQQTLNNVVSDGYRLQIIDDQWKFRVSTSGASVDIGVPMTWPIGPGDAVGFRAVGNTLSAYHSRDAVAGNWTLVGSVVDTTFPNVIGHIGVQVGDTTARLDDFGGGSLTTVIPTLPLPLSGLSDPMLLPTGPVLYPRQQPYFPPATGGAVNETPTPGGATAGGFSPTAQVPVPVGGALAGGVGPTATVPVPQGGGVGQGVTPTVTVPVPQGGATAGGPAPGATTSVTPGGATAGGLGPTARVSITIGGAVAGGFSPTDSTSVSETPVPGGALAGGFGPTATTTVTAGGATAGGFAPLSTQTPPPGGALGGGLGPTVQVTLQSGGATAGGYGPNDGSAPSGPTVLEDPNHFILLHA